MSRSTDRSVWKRFLAMAGGALLAWGLAGAAPAAASTFSYAYIGEPDTDCAVQALGGTGTCRVEGSFELESSEFGLPQFALNAAFTLFANDVAVDNAFFPAIKIFEVFPTFCISFCNEAEAEANGDVTDLDLHIFPPSALDNAISLSETTWSWDVFRTGEGVFSSGVARVVNLGPTAIPLPPTATLAGAALLVAGGFAYWRPRTRRRAAAI